MTIGGVCGIFNAWDSEELHRVMKGSPPTAGREYGEEWAPCVKGGIFLLSEKTDFFFLLRKKIRKVLRIR